MANLLNLKGGKGKTLELHSARSFLNKKSVSTAITGNLSKQH